MGKKGGKAPKSHGSDHNTARKQTARAHAVHYVQHYSRTVHTLSSTMNALHTHNAQHGYTQHVAACC